MCLWSWKHPAALQTSKCVPSHYITRCFVIIKFFFFLKHCLHLKAYDNVLFHFPFPFRSFVMSRRRGQSSSEYKIQLKHFMLSSFSPWVNSRPTNAIATWEALLVSVHDGFDVAEKQKNKTHFNCVVTWKPQTLLVGHLDQWMSRALKSFEKTVVWVSVTFENMHLFMRGSW